METFESWMDRVREMAVAEFGYEEAVVAAFNPDDWRGFFEDGYSPHEALSEEHRPD